MLNCSSHVAVKVGTPTGTVFLSHQKRLQVQAAAIVSLARLMAHIVEATVWSEIG